MAEASRVWDAIAAVPGPRTAALAVLLAVLAACKPVSGPVRFHAE